MSNILRLKIEQALIGPALAEAGAQISAKANAFAEESNIADIILSFVDRELVEIKKSLEEEPKHEPLFASVFEFVDDWLLAVYPYTEARSREVKWTQYWWTHPEAVLRLTALWQRFENLRASEPATYLETFLRLHADYHMKVLMASDGVFDDSKRQDTPSIPLPSAPIPKAE